MPQKCADNCEKKINEGNDWRGVFQGTMRNSPRIAESSFRVAAWFLVYEALSLVLKMSVQSHGMT